MARRSPPRLGHICWSAAACDQPLPGTKNTVSAEILSAAHRSAQRLSSNIPKRLSPRSLKHRRICRNRPLPKRDTQLLSSRAPSLSFPRCDKTGGGQYSSRSAFFGSGIFLDRRLGTGRRPHWQRPALATCHKSGISCPQRGEVIPPRDNFVYFLSRKRLLHNCIGSLNPRSWRL